MSQKKGIGGGRERKLGRKEKRLQVVKAGVITPWVAVRNRLVE